MAIFLFSFPCAQMKSLEPALRPDMTYSIYSFLLSLVTTRSDPLGFRSTWYVYGESPIHQSINHMTRFDSHQFSLFQRLHKHNTFTVTVNVIKCPSSFKCENEDGKGFKKQYSINLIWVCSVMFYTWQSHVIVSSNITANQVPYANQYNGYQYNVDFLTLLFFFV